MGKSESKQRNLKGNKQEQFLSIEKKISKRFGQVIILSCVILGVISSVLSYISSISAVSETIDNTSDVAANYVSTALEVYVSVAYETGSIARLADPERSAEEKQAILQQRINDHDFTGGYLLQTASYLPYFISWVIAANIFITFLSADGVINNLLMAIGFTDEQILLAHRELECAAHVVLQNLPAPGALEGGHLHRLDGIARLGDQPLLHPPLRAHEQNFTAGVHSRQTRYAVLFAFIVQHFPKETERFRDSLTVDLYLREKVKTRPDFARDLRPYREEIRKIYQKEERERRYLPDYTGFDSRQMERITHLEVLEDGRMLLFDYRNRDPLSYNARVVLYRGEKKQ